MSMAVCILNVWRNKRSYLIITRACSSMYGVAIAFISACLFSISVRRVLGRVFGWAIPAGRAGRLGAQVGGWVGGGRM